MKKEYLLPSQILQARQSKQYMYGGMPSMKSIDGGDIAMNSLQGAASGAAAGAVFGGIGAPIGAAIGFVGSAISGLFNSNAQREAQYKRDLEVFNQAIQDDQENANTIRDNVEFNTEGRQYYSLGGKIKNNTIDPPRAPEVITHPEYTKDQLKNDFYSHVNKSENASNWGVTKSDQGTTYGVYPPNENIDKKIVTYKDYTRDQIIEMFNDPSKFKKMLVGDGILVSSWKPQIEESFKKHMGRDITIEDYVDGIPEEVVQDVNNFIFDDIYNSTANHYKNHTGGDFTKLPNWAQLRMFDLAYESKGGISTYVNTMDAAYAGDFERFKKEAISSYDKPNETRQKQYESILNKMYEDNIEYVKSLESQLLEHVRYDVTKHMPSNKSDSNLDPIEKSIISYNESKSKSNTKKNDDDMNNMITEYDELGKRMIANARSRNTTFKPTPIKFV